jgi:hypothetical protein
MVMVISRDLSQHPATFFYETFSVIASPRHLTFCEERFGAMDLWAVPAHGGTTEWVSEAQVRRSHAIIRR